jgi:5-formyltetrahydrofolate cyclo-ligase
MRSEQEAKREALAEARRKAAAQAEARRAAKEAEEMKAARRALVAEKDGDDESDGVVEVF